MPDQTTKYDVRESGHPDASLSRENDQQGLDRDLHARAFRRLRIVRDPPLLQVLGPRRGATRAGSCIGMRQLPQGTVNANRLEVADSGDVIRFDGDVTMMLTSGSHFLRIGGNLGVP